MHLFTIIIPETIEQLNKAYASYVARDFSRDRPAIAIPILRNHATATDLVVGDVIILTNLYTNGWMKLV